MRAFVRFAVLGALCMAPAALAQEPGGISSELERYASTPQSEKLTYATNANQEIGEAEKEVSRRLAAKKGGDPADTECLLTKLTAIRALQTVSERAEGAMKEAFAAGNEEKGNHEFRKIAVAVSKTRMLRAEANRCGTPDEAGGGAPTIVDWESFLQEYGDVFDDFDLDDLDFGQDPPQESPFGKR